MIRDDETPDRRFRLLPPRSTASGLRAADAPFDLILANGHIVDGTGSPWYAGDVGIRDGRIAAIGNLGQAPAKRRIDAPARSWPRDSSTCWGSRS